MKVLFAVNNENISESIIKKYQQEYKEIISAKNVYYFNAIIKELQRDKTYDRIIISEDLQPFSNNNYDTIDKFIFEKMDSISDEATNQSGADIPIILICTDRREKSEPLLVKLFGIGVYNALLGKDRSITQVCELLARPRTKKEAKVYYHIDSEDVDYKVENEGDVSEVEIQNILNHYKKIGGNEEKYVESFDHIASQYTDSQLRLIAKFLPLNVKAVLEANSMKYQEIISFAPTGSTPSKEYTPPSLKNNKSVKFTKQKNATSDEKNLDLIEKNIGKSNLTEPVIIPSAINTQNVRKMQENTNANTSALKRVQPAQTQEIDDILEDIPSQENQSANNVESSKPEPVQEVQPKKGRGRPKKVVTEVAQPVNETPKKGRGRPKKVVDEQPQMESTQQNSDNNLSNNAEEYDQISQNETATAPLNLFELGDEEEPITNESSSENDMILPGLDDDEMLIENDNPTVANTVTSNSVEDATVLPSFEEEYTPNTQMNNTNVLEQTSSNYENHPGLFSNNQKIVAFVGTSKNGTSFLVNNVAELLSKQGINTAILDLTKNKNAYYIYTKNEESIRKVAYSCMNNLVNGNATGIQVHNNLTVYTTLPGEDEASNNYSNILQTLSKNYSLVILDCDFETNYNYFKEVQEIYLIQSLDVLTIQPLTAFLRELKAKNVLYPEKIRIALNKVIKLRGISDKTIIGGMAFYNDPAMSFMTELFNKDTVQYCTIPFDEQAYSKYLEGLINCEITLNGYSKNFIAMLEKLGEMVYPLINNSKNNNKYNNYQTKNNFSNDINNTLNKMKNNY